MADVTLFGLDPAGHHLTNVLLHGLNAALVFLVLAALTGAPGQSAAVALLFAIHPLRVESVAWVTERKDLLSVCFALLTIDAYRRWVRAPSVGRYLATCVLYALALLSKPMVVTLPALLLLLDVWPLARHEVGWARRVVEKLPLAALAALVSWVTIAVAGPRDGLARRGAARRAARQCRRVVRAVSRGDGVARRARRLLSAPAAVADARRRRGRRRRRRRRHRGARAPPARPVGRRRLGLVRRRVAAGHRDRPGGHAGRADRFTYLPSLGVLVALVWSVAALVRTRPTLRSAAVAALLLAVVGFGGATRNALAWWRDDHALFERALAVTDRNWFIHANYGDTFFFEGRFDEAAAQYEQSLAIEPRTATTLARLGTIELRRGDADGAIGHFAAALRVKPDMDDAAGPLASALESRGMPPADAAAAVASLRSSIDRSQADLGRPYGREYREGLMRALWQANTGVVMRCHDAVGAGRRSTSSSPSTRAAPSPRRAAVRRRRSAGASPKGSSAHACRRRRSRRSTRGSRCGSDRRAT
jgi:tetratricopeptide (TPR) repeat protein